MSSYTMILMSALILYVIESLHFAQNYFMDNQITYNKCKCSHMLHTPTYKLISFLSLLLILLTLQPTVSQTSYTSTLTPGQRGNTHSHTITSYGTGDVIQITFQATSTRPLTTTSLKVNFAGAIQPESIQVKDFYHLNPVSQNLFDLDAMWQARQQYINVYKPAGATTLYLTVFNFDPSYRQGTVTYTINVYGNGLTSYQCANCANGQNHPLTSCFCTNCNFQMIGQRCSRLITKLEKNVTVSLASQKQTYFAIEDSDKLTVQIAIVGGAAQAYFQFQQFDNEVASYYNVARGSSDGRYLINNTVLRVGADPQKRKLLMTLVNMQPHAINATIGYSQETAVSVLVIVMAVLGGVLLIALIIAVVCIIKKRNASGNRINSELNLPSETNKLTGEQIQRYFPPCILLQVQQSSAETSMNPLATNLTQKQVANGSEQDCVICLQQISGSDQIRMGYCKHMFHGTCLISWFKKQRNCPYCRKQYNRDETTTEYNKLVTENGNRVLKDIDLVRAIYNRKIMSNTVIQSLE